MPARAPAGDDARGRCSRALAPAIEEITAGDLAGDFPAIQYVPPQDELSVDIPARLGDEFRFEDIESHRIELQGVPVIVATPRMLYRLKKDTVRPQDHADAAALREKFSLGDD